MTTHYHRCNLCPATPVECTSAYCWTEPQLDGATVVQVGKPRACEACEAQLSTIDDFDAPKRGELSGAALVRCVARATRAGLTAAATDPERASEAFARYVDPLAPVDETRTDHDTWYRIGAVAGAKDAWAAPLPPGPVFRAPPDAPRGEAGACYVQAWNAAGSIVVMIRMEAGKC